MQPGDPVQIQGNGFKAQATLTTTFESTPVTLPSIGSANASGAFSATVTVPTTAAAGSHNIRVRGVNALNGIHTVSFPITVVSSVDEDDTDTTANVASASPTPPAARRCRPRV